MKQQGQALSEQQDRWRWPLDVHRYDRNPILSEQERAELERKLSEDGILIRKYTYVALHRLLQPIDDVLKYLNAPQDVYPTTIRVMMLEMRRRGTAFWAWTLEEWRESICADGAAFSQRYGWHHHPNHPSHHYLPLVAYLLDVHPDAGELIELLKLHRTAQSIFGQVRVDEAVQRIQVVLQGWGYKQRDRMTFLGCVSYLLIRNRSPYLEDLSGDLLESLDRTCKLNCVQKKLYQVSRALVALGIVARPIQDGRGTTTPVTSGTDGSVGEEWLSWCRRWLKQSTLQRKEEHYYQLLKAGRWLKALHPEITSPSQWTYELAAELVAALNEMRIGEWTDPQNRARVPAERLGKPLRPNAKVKLLKAMRVLLWDSQELGWAPVQINPDRAFRTPRSLRTLLGPDPRVIDKDLWAKLLWAAMNLQADDLPQSRGNAVQYPVEMVRAIAMVWCFAALRSDEIVRLRVGCVRWQYEDVMIPETGEMLPKDAVCFLDVPVNKTSMAYTKAVHPLVGKRVNEWERTRPREQLRTLDRKTSETVQFLFSYRGSRVSKKYINESLIPILCRKAGISRQDSRGSITSHRARATIASMLYNAKEPLSIYELKEYLGHKHLSSTQNYLRVDPTKLASKVAKAGYLEQNLATIEVLLDQDAVRSGAAARGEPWKYYDLGHGFCVNDFWADCKHRMACARCPFYRPKNSTMEQLVEGKANLVHMLEFITLTEEERLLVTEGIELHQALIEQLADVPTPAGPTPRELEVQRQGETKVIPIKNVRRTRSKQHEQ